MNPRKLLLPVLAMLLSVASASAQTGGYTPPLDCLRAMNLVCLAGRAGGQTLIGGTGSGDTLTLQSTSDATKGTIRIDDAVLLWPSSAGTSVSTTNQVFQPFRYGATGLTVNGLSARIDGITIDPGMSISAAGAAFNGILVSPTITVDTSGSGNVISALRSTASVTSTVAPALSQYALLSSGATVQSSTASVPPLNKRVLLDQTILQASGGVNVGTVAAEATAFDGATTRVTGAGTQMTVTSYDGLSSQPIFKSETGGGTPSALTINTRRVVRGMDPTQTATGTLTVDNNLIVDCEDQTIGTLRACVRGLIDSGTGKWFLYSPATAASAHVGGFRIGDTTAPGAGALSLAPVAAPGSPILGDIWLDSTQQGLVAFFGQSTANGIKEYDSRVLFVATGTASVDNASTETSLLGTGIGAKTLPANFLVPGKTIRVSLRGHWRSQATPGVLTLRMKLGSTVIASVALTPTSGIGPFAWAFSGDFTNRTTGSSGTEFAEGEATFYQGTGGQASHTWPLRNAMPPTTVTVNTTTTQALDVTAQWATASTTNEIYIYEGSVEVLE